MHLVEGQTCRPNLQSWFVAIRRLGWRTVQNFEQYPHTDERAAELNVEASEPFRRFIGEQKGGDEGEELTGRRAGLDHAIAAVNHGDGNGNSAERLHQRT